MRYMSSDQFRKEYEYGVEQDFALEGVAASFKTPPRTWGSEDARMELPQSTSKHPSSSSAAISSDGKFIAASSGNLVVIFDVESKKQLHTLNGPLENCQRLSFVPSLPPELSGYTLAAEHAAVDGSVGTILFWKLTNDGHPETLLPALNIPDLASRSVNHILPTLGVEEAALTEELERGYAKALEKLNAQLVTRDIPQVTGHLPSFNLSTLCTSFTSSSLMLYLEKNGSTQHGMRPEAELPKIRIYDTSSHSVQETLGGHTDAIMWAAYSPDGSKVASASWDGTFKIWQRSADQAWELKHSIGPSGGQCWSGTWSPDGKHILFSGMARSEERGAAATLVAVYEVETGKQVARLQHEHLKHWVRQIDWCPSADLIALACGKRVWIWNPFTDTLVSEFVWDGQEEDFMRFVGCLGLRWIDDGRKLVLCCTEGTIEVWDRVENAKWRFQRPKGAEARAYSKGLLYLENTNEVVSLDGDGVIRFWKL